MVGGNGAVPRGKPQPCLVLADLPRELRGSQHELDDNEELKLLHGIKSFHYLYLSRILRLDGKHWI